MRRYHAFTVTLFLLLDCLAMAAMFQRDSTARFKVLDFDGNPISNAVVNVNIINLALSILSY